MLTPSLLINCTIVFSSRFWRPLMIFEIRPVSMNSSASAQPFGVWPSSDSIQFFRRRPKSSLMSSSVKLPGRFFIPRQYLSRPAKSREILLDSKVSGLYCESSSMIDRLEEQHKGASMKEKTFAPRTDGRYAVAFRKHETGSPACQWIEVTIVGGSRELAVNHAK